LKPIDYTDPHEVLDTSRSRDIIQINIYVDFGNKCKEMVARRKMAIVLKGITQLYQHKVYK